MYIYKLVLCLSLNIAETGERGMFLVGLAKQITNNVTRNICDIGELFSNQLSNLSIVINTQGVSQVWGSFDMDLRKFRDWIKCIEKHVLLVGLNEKQTKHPAYQTNYNAISDCIQYFMTENPESTLEQMKSELSARFTEVNDSQYVFMILY